MIKVNYLVKMDNDQFIFKTYRYSHSLLAKVVAENDALQYLHTQATDKFPRPIPFQDGTYVQTTHLGGERIIARMLPF